MADIDFKYVICSGEPDYETILKPLQEEGYIIIYTGKANTFRPSASETDTIVFAAKPMEEKKLMGYMNYIENKAKKSVKG